MTFITYTLCLLSPCLGQAPRFLVFGLHVSRPPCFQHRRCVFLDLDPEDVVAAACKEMGAGATQTLSKALRRRFLRWALGVPWFPGSRRPVSTTQLRESLNPPRPKSQLRMTVVQ